MMESSYFSKSCSREVMELVGASLYLKSTNLKQMAGILDVQNKKYKLDTGRLKFAASILRVVSHHTRLEIIHILDLHGSLTVSEMMSIIDIDQSALSHHLIKMRRAGVVETEKTGRHIHYSLKIREITKILDCMESCGFLLKG